jgi:hypothetical protein
MSQSAIIAEPAETNENYQQAVTLTRRIKANAAVAAGAIVAFSKDLKQMRDEKLYIQLGYENFETYTKQEFNIEQRQAYNYIGIYEKYGETFLQSNASLGITKLALLAEVSDADRTEFMENNDLDGMSVRDMRELVEKTKQQGEQLSFLTDECDKAKNDAKLQAEISKAEQIEKIKIDTARREAEKKLAEAQNRIVELEKAEPDAAALEKFRKEAEKKAKKDFDDKLKAEKVKLEAEKQKAAQAALAEAEGKIKAAREEGEKAAAEKIKADLEAAEQKLAAAVKEAETYKKELTLAKDDDSRDFARYYSEVQETFNKLCGLVLKVSAKDTEKAEKLRGALKAMLDKQANDIQKV